MDLLPKDVMLIVDRYVFDYLYTTLKQQYIATYLTYPTRWSNDDMGFMRFSVSGRHDWAIANWRKIPVKGDDWPVCGLNKGPKESSRKYYLPKNY